MRYRPNWRPADGFSSAAAAVLLAALGALAGCSGSSGGTADTDDESPAAESSAPETEGAVRDTEIAPGTTGVLSLGDRPVELHVPSSYDSTATSLVVFLHGLGAPGQGVSDWIKLLPASEDRGFLLALPEGTTDEDGAQFWNATDACCDFAGTGVDDSGHLADVIRAAADDYAVDPGRTFVIGFSNGAFMAHRLACDHAELVAAVVSIAGAQNADRGACTPAQPVSVLEVHGTADEQVPFEGGVVMPGHPFPSAEETVAQWRALDRCADGRAPVDPLDADGSLAGAETVRTAWDDCSRGAQVALWTVAGAGHVPDFTPEFTQSMLDWLDAQARPAG